MDWSTLLFFIENGLFWLFVYFIVAMGCETPTVVFTGFGFFLLYWVFRSASKQEGGNRLVAFYVINVVLTLLLSIYFVTGSSLQKSLRTALNSAAKRLPSLEPYVRRC